APGFVPPGVPASGVPPEPGGVVPASAAGGVVPASAEGGVVPASTEGGVVPASTEGGVVPASIEGGVVPASAEGGVVPASIVGELVSPVGGDAPPEQRPNARTPSTQSKARRIGTPACEAVHRLPGEHATSARIGRGA